VQAVRHNFYQTALSYNLAWARTHLKNAGALQNRSRGLWSITREGERLTATDFSLGPPRVRGRSSEHYEAGELVDQPEISADIEAAAPSWTDKVRSFLRGLTARRSKV
jgi:restriction system protein